jgi:Tol biopolymer transport system component
MHDAVQQALDAVADSTGLDWAALEADLSDEQTLSMLHALREIAVIARVHDAPAPSPRRSLPFTWGPLEARRFIARGAHGEVFRAWDPRLEREVALKLLRSAAGDEDEAGFAITEGRLLARVSHPNVVAVYGADRIQGQAGIWMELVDGGTVRELVSQDGPLTAQKAIEIGTAVCSGLSAIHAAGLIHRDVKAQNVVRSRDGRTILMDLSVGQDVADGGEGIEGTPVYLAPELLNGGRATVASDIYATGVLLFFLVTGQYPVAATSLDDLRRRHRAGHADKLAPTASISRQFSAVVNRALAKNPGDRYASADELRSALNAAPIRSPRLSFVMVAATVVLAAGVGAGALVLTNSKPGAAAPAATISAGVSTQAASPRRIQTPAATMGRPRADGTEFPYVDANGHLRLWEVATGRSRLIAEAGPVAGAGRVAAMSENGDHVAFGWHAPDGGFELRVVSRDGSAARALVPRTTTYETVPVEWSRDGRSILCWLQQQNGSTDLVLVPTDRGSPRLLHTLPPGKSAYASLSPDGRFVVLSATFNAASPQGMQIIETSGAVARVLLETPAIERLARWTPDGAHIYFLRDSPTVPVSRDAWMVSAQDGVLQGEPWLTTQDLGAVSSLTLTPDGEVLRLLSLISAEVYTAPFDLSGNGQSGPPTRIDPAEIGNHVAPSWSPDGRSLAYFTTVARTPGATPSRTLTVKDMVSGKARQVPVPLLFVAGYTPRWSPDGRHVMILGRNEDRVESFAYFQVTLETGELVPVVTLGSSGPAYAQYSGDGRHFYYVHHPRGLVRRDLANGEEVVSIARGGRSELGPFAVSPDGDTVAFVGSTETNGRWTSVLEVQRFDGTSRVLASAVEPDYVSLHAWTPDSEALLFARGTGATPYQLWRIPAAGGPATDLRFSLVRTPNGISLSPDGQRIAFTERVMQQELWITPAAAAQAR